MSALRILVVGGGGREHALCWRIRRDRPDSELFAAPGNGGIEALAALLPLEATDLEGIVAWCLKARPDLVVIGPDEPLALGIVDVLGAVGIAAFGPTAAAARIESSKAWADDVLAAAGVPRPRTWVFDSPGAADAFARTHHGPLVVKADGLARGKGVMVCATPTEAHAAIDAVGRRRDFGSAGDRIVLQERLSGPELSVFALSDGVSTRIIGAARDHKRLGDGDSGPNTGGMGAYSPVTDVSAPLLARIHEDVLAPTVGELRRRGSPFIGFLYAGLMLTPDGPRVLEFNSRLGDPEAQVLLPLLRFDIVEAMLAAVGGRLESFEAGEAWEAQRAAVCVVMASRGYPGVHEGGMEIEGLGALAPEVLAFHAATTRVGSRLLTAGGRVLGITGLGESVPEARARAYAGVGQIRFSGATWRSDIAAGGA